MHTIIALDQTYFSQLVLHTTLLAKVDHCASGQGLEYQALTLIVCCLLTRFIKSKATVIAEMSNPPSQIYQG